MLGLVVDHNRCKFESLLIKILAILVRISAHFKLQFQALKLEQENNHCWLSRRSGKSSGSTELSVVSGLRGPQSLNPKRQTRNPKVFWWRFWFSWPGEGPGTLHFQHVLPEMPWGAFEFLKSSVWQILSCLAAFSKAGVCMTQFGAYAEGQNVPYVEGLCGLMCLFCVLTLPKSAMRGLIWIIETRIYGVDSHRVKSFFREISAPLFLRVK